MTNKELSELRAVLSALVKKYQEQLEQDGYVIVSKDIKILNYPKDCQSIKYFNKWFYFEFKMQNFGIVDNQDLHEVYVKNTFLKNIGKFELFLWENNYVRIYDVEKIKGAKLTETNIILSDVDIEQDEIDNAVIEHKLDPTIKRYNSVDYWLFKFSNAWEIESDFAPV